MLLSLLIPTSKHATSALITFLLVSAPSPTDAAAKTCDAALSCSGQTISIDDTVSGYGYKSLYEADVTNTDCDNTCVDCMGGYSCASAVDLYAKNKQGVQRCYGASSCINAERIYGGMIMAGLSAAANTVLIASSAYEDNILCEGDHSCSYATMTVHENLEADGAYALFGSTITSNTNIDVYLRGHFAAYGATLTCRSSDKCYVYCYGTGCAGFFVDCQGTCTITLGADATAPMTDLSQLSDVEDPFYTIDVVSLAESVESDCNTQNKARTFDDDEDNYPIEDVVVSSKKEPVCCRGRNSCREAVIATSGAAVTCQASFGCRDSSIESDAAVLCIAFNGCSKANVVTTQTLYCAATEACYAAERLTAPAIYCTGLQGMDHGRSFHSFHCL